MSVADVIVVGGGVAGISAAVHLADAGFRVTLLEQRKLLGGRAASFEHTLGPGGLLDNCQHVLLGCCTELQALYRRLGAEHLVRFDDAIWFADAKGRQARMQAVMLPSPLHLGPSLVGFGFLTLRQKLEIARAMMQMYIAGRRGRDAREGISFEAYLRSCGQSGATIAAYWDVITVSALNEGCGEASAKYGMQVFQESFLAARGGYRLGYARAPLGALYENIRGVELRLGAGVRRLRVEQGRVVGVELTGGEVLSARQVVLATSPGGTLALLREVAGAEQLVGAIERLEFRAIMGVHLLYDRPVGLDRPVAMLGTNLHWVFPDPQRPELLHGVVSAADRLPETDLPALFDAEVRAALPAFGEAKLIDKLLVTEKRATFRPLPGVDAIRPAQATDIAGLTLAGDYTRTDWPATMEGAARSGRLAAGVVQQTLKLT